MRKILVVLCTSIFLFVLPSISSASENLEDASEDKQKKGLIGSVLSQVKETVDKTVTSTGELVEETVTFTGDTVERTVGMTTEAVHTVTDPKQEKPVKTIVDNATDFVGETVEKTVPVVEQTTETVQTVTNEAVKVTKPLPNVPVVTPVVEQTTETVNQVTDQVKQTVDETVGTVSDTVSNPLKKRPEKTTPPTVGEKPHEEPATNQDGTEALPVEQVEQPNRPVVTEPVHKEQIPVADPGQEETSVSDEPVVRKGIEQASSPATQGVEPIGEQVAMALKPVRDYKKTPVTVTMDMPNGASPLSPTNSAFWMSDVQLITGASSISASGPSITPTMNGFGAVLADDWLMTAEVVRQKWYLEDLLGSVQWSHAPPGQPPQSTPFLYVN